MNNILMLKLLRSNLIDLPVNISLSYFWCGGFMLGVTLLFQILSGIVLSFLYVANEFLSFSCVVELTQDSFYCWGLRYTHIWGVTVIFFLLFIHIGRSLYYSSYSKLGVWNVGFLLYLMMMAEAFLGYVLPWHQMSYWAATVITSIIQSIPIIGEVLYTYIVGGFSVTNVTLMRVFPAHICLGFIIIGFSVLHMFYLHKSGSNNPLCLDTTYSDAVLFHCYYTFKDVFIFTVLVTLFTLFALISPDFFLDPEGFVEADPMVTPSSIKPEWYFLSYYAMLRSVESKLGGMFLTVIFLLVLWVPTFNDSSAYCLFRQIVFWVFCSLYVLLTYLGSCHPEYPFVEVSKWGSFLMIFLLILFKSLWLVPYSNGIPYSDMFKGWQGLYF